MTTTLKKKPKLLEQRATRPAPLTTPATVAEFTDVSKTYRKLFRPGWTLEALRGVSLTIHRGEVFALLGPNRAGKTTLVKILLGLCQASSGRITRLGRPLSERATLARIGYMHENQAFPRYLTARQLLDFYGSLSWLSASEVKKRAAVLLEKVGLADRAHEPIARFSKGMVQRLALAQALLTDPELLILDEPMEGLDLGGRQMLQDVLKQQRAQGKTVLIVSHALGEVAQVCDRVAVLVGGRLAHLGPLAGLLQDSRSGKKRTIEEALTPIYDLK